MTYTQLDEDHRDTRTVADQDNVLELELNAQLQLP